MSAAVVRTDAHREVKNPFPGLRPFEVHESELLFGREDEIQELLSRLRRTRFLAVVGSSGCGKSSVVRAGLVASLQDGFMAETTAPWRIAIMRPGNNPVAQLALALNAEEALGSTGSDPEESVVMRHATLRRGALGLIEECEEASLAPGSKLLLLVDQFEELFRFMRESPTSANKPPKDEGDRKDQAAGLRGASTADESQAFVKLLLAAALSSVPVYVVLTMRSEFLGNCANFSGLPEAINHGLYLLPQMSREQLRDVIQEPIQVCGGQISPRLVSRLLNDLGDADQLPILQHAMMRMWSEWSPNRQGGPIDLEHYKKIGELRASLSAHAEETYETLTESQKEIAELLFRTITETTEDQQTVRRPTKFSVICDIVRHAGEDNATPREESKLTIGEVTSVADKFREEGRSFLMPPADRPLEPQTVIDISHESLIRQWDRLREWAEKEARFTKIRRRLRGAAEEWQEKNRTDATLLYTGARLIQAEEYTKDRGTTLTPLEKEFIEASDAQSEAERARKLEEARREAKSRFQRRMMLVFIVATIISSVAGVLAFTQYRAAWTAQGEAETARLQAEAARGEEEAAKRRAESALLKQRLLTYGWKDEQLSNVDGNQGTVQDSEAANGRLQQIYDPSSVPDAERRKSILITYYRKPPEAILMEGVLPGLGFRVKALDSSNASPTNVIWVNPEVIDRGDIKLDDVKLVAYALIRAGIQIRRIGPPSSVNRDWRTGRDTWRTNRDANIWIGSNAAFDNMPALTVEQVQSASAFRDEP